MCQQQNSSDTSGTSNTWPDKVRGRGKQQQHGSQVRGERGRGKGRGEGGGTNITDQTRRWHLGGGGGGWGRGVGAHDTIPLVKNWARQRKCILSLTSTHEKPRMRAYATRRADATCTCGVERDTVAQWYPGFVTGTPSITGTYTRCNPFEAKRRSSKVHKTVAGAQSVEAGDAERVGGGGKERGKKGG